MYTEFVNRHYIYYVNLNLHHESSSISSIIDITDLARLLSNMYSDIRSSILPIYNVHYLQLNQSINHSVHVKYLHSVKMEHCSLDMILYIPKVNHVVYSAETLT